MQIPIPNPIHIEVTGAKILGIKKYNVNIIDAWRDKNVYISKPLVKYNPPNNLIDVINVGIAESLSKKEKAVAASKKEINSKIGWERIANSVNTNGYPYRGGIISYTNGGALFTWPNLGNMFGSIANTISSGVSSVASGASKVGGDVENWFNQAGKTIENTVGDIKNVWDTLMNLSEVVNQLSDFLKQWKKSYDVSNQNILDMMAETKSLSNMANNLVLENRKLYAELSTKMSESLAKYFDDLTYNLLKYGQVSVPTAVVGAITISAQNTSAVPLTLTIPDLVVKSGPYTLHKGLYVLNMLPFEKDAGDIPFDINGVEESKYIINHKESNEPIPIEVHGTMLTPFGKKEINIVKNVML